jgi:hypothetical protein
LLAVKTVAVTPDAQVNVELEIPQGPLEDFNVKPEPGPSQYLLKIFLPIISYLRL